MPDMYRGKIPIIRRTLNEGFMSGDGGENGRGCIPRDYDVEPVEMGDSPAGLQLYEESEWDACFDEQEASESSLEHMYLRGDKPAFVNLDQGPNGYCWAFSVGQAVMLDRLKMNVPPVRLNPTATAAIIKGGRDQGGWCGLSCKFGQTHGWAVEGNGPGEWPGNLRSLKYDTPELRANMLLHKIEESWYDLGRREYDQVLSKKQLFTLGFSNMPGAVDYNRFAHSMCFVRVVRIEPGSWGVMVLNSWKNWGYHGLGVLADMWPDNAVAIRSTTPSVR